jgi:hypothetical protein
MRHNLIAFRLMLTFVAAVLSFPAIGQTLTPLDSLIGYHGSVTAGDITFSNFQKPKVLPSPVGLLDEFNDIGVAAAVMDDGRVSLTFTGIDPATGSPRALTVGGGAGAEIIRLVSYNVTATNPTLSASFGRSSVRTRNRYHGR